MSGAARKSGEAQTAQVVTLLNQLGDRLVRGEHERLAVREEIQSTREMLSDLENRADMAERIFLTMQDNISKKETAADHLVERQNRLEKMYQDSVERLKRAEALTSQIEEAVALQNSLARRLEKTAQDKVRMMNKIEHLEAAVEETRQSLNSGALVGITIPQPPANDPARMAASPKSWWKTPWWQAPARKQAATLVSLAIAGLLCGVALNQLIIHWPHRAVHAPVIAMTDTATETVIPAPLAQSDRDGAPATATDANPFTTTLSTAQDDLAPYGEDVFLEAMETDPDALAATLNNIEPGNSDATALREDSAALSAAAPVTETAPAVQAAQVTQVTQDPAVENFIAGERATTPLTARITPDASLPTMVRTIEAKAFEGIPEAQHDLAAIYTAGHAGVAVDYDRAALWFREAALQGIANARYNLGVLYHQGLGVDRDVARALEWYRSAAALDHPEAQYNLGIAAIEGIGTAYDPAQAAAYFESAARGGVMEAAYNLGLIHENGLLGDTDMNEAVFWYSTAADHNPEARAALNQVTRALGLNKQDIERVVKEYGALYKLQDGAALKKAEAPRAASGAKLAATTSHDPAALARIIPPLSAAESRVLLNALNTDSAGDNRAMMAQLQEQLIKIGLYPGPADGIGGPQTEDAIRTYQSRNGLEVTGRASDQLLGHLMAREQDITGLASR